jgi:hypothetical protein
MIKVYLTVLTGRRPDLLEKTLDAASEYIDRCDGQIGVVWDPEDKESATVLTKAGVKPVSDLVRSNGEATSLCADFFLSSDRDVWFHLEDDWELIQERAELEPDWFDVAATLATNPDIGQVRLREFEHLGGLVPLHRKSGVVFLGDGSGCANRNWVTSKLVEWKTEEAWPFLVSADTQEASPSHWTNNPFMASRAVVEQVFCYPVRNELHAMDRYHAARNAKGGRYATAQLRPGVFRHIGDGRSIEGH